MSHHRGARHVLGVAACFVLLAATAGCRHAPFHRFGDEKAIGPDGKPVGYQEPLAPLDQASAAPAPPASAPAPAARAPITAVVSIEPAVERPAPAATATSTTPTPARRADPVIPPAETPLLDAALKRAQAIEAEQRRELRAQAAESSESKVEPAPAPVIAVATATVTAKPAAPPRDDAVQRASAESPAVPSEADRAKLWSACADLVDRLPADLSAAAVPAILPRAVAMLAPAATSSEPEPATVEAPPPPFRIDAVRLCRRIGGFGAFEAMDVKALKAGRPVLIYCELSGLTYQSEGDQFVSRVATRVELIDARDGSKAWEAQGNSEERCPSLRHDSFVSTRVNLPPTLAPGDYTIRLTQADVLSDQAATAELAVTIGR